MLLALVDIVLMIEYIHTCSLGVNFLQYYTIQ